MLRVSGITTKHTWGFMSEFTKNSVVLVAALIFIYAIFSLLAGLQNTELERPCFAYIPAPPYSLVVFSKCDGSIREVEIKSSKKVFEAIEKPLI